VILLIAMKQTLCSFHASCDLGPDDNHSSITALHKQQEDKLQWLVALG
jgi:hypothetical protein